MTEPVEPDASREQLSAYLDGELEAPAARQMEEQLKSNAQLRGELQRYERAWDMLDQLEKAEVDASFTQSTLEMVIATAATERDDERARAPRLRRRLAAWIVSAVLVAGAAGFLSGRLLWPDPNLQLVRDLPVLENIDLYDQGESLDFLRQLQRKNLFAQEPEHAP